MSIKRVAVSAGVVLVLAVGFTLGSWWGRQQAEIGTIRIQAKLDYQYEVVRELNEELVARDIIDSKMLSARPDSILYYLDAQIDLLASGNKYAIKGSLSDYVIPLLLNARGAGIPAAAIQARLKRIHALAKEGIYWSSFLTPDSHWSQRDIDQYFADLQEAFVDVPNGE